MKYKVKISNLSFDIEFESVEDKPSRPEKPEPPVIEPPIIPEIPDRTILNLDEILTGEEGSIYRLPESMNNKWVTVRCSGNIKPTIRGIIGENTFLQFESWDKAPTQLIDLEGVNDFFIRGIQFVCPPDRPIRTACPDKEVFGWKRETVTQGKFAWIDAPEVLDKDLMTYGLCRFGYSSDTNSDIYLIGKGLNHNGYNFTQIKNPYEGNLFLCLQDIRQHNPIIRGPQSHYYTPTDFQIKISVEKGVAKIISENTFDQILTWAGYNNGNQRSILHFDRFVYDISEEQLIDNKTLRLDMNELQAGDVIDKGRVTRKQVDFTRQTNWSYEIEDSPEDLSRTFPEGTYYAYIIYKGNAGFSNGHVNESTPFGHPEVLLSQGYGWSWYNESFSGYIENFQGSGYFRNSGGGKTKGLTIRNSSFGKNPPTATTDHDMPQECADFIDLVESL